MIFRLWHGYTKPEHADEYERMLKEIVLPGIHRIEGYLGAHLMRRDLGEEVEFITITTWDSWEAIERFAGPTRNASVIYDEAYQLLTRCDHESTHYDAAWVP